jgi:hypothetical protein
MPQLLQVLLIAKGVHRLPKAAMLVRGKLTGASEGFERLPLPHAAIIWDQV